MGHNLAASASRTPNQCRATVDNVHECVVIQVELSPQADGAPCATVVLATDKDSKGKISK